MLINKILILEKIVGKGYPSNSMKFSSIRAFIKHLEGSETTGFASLYLVISPAGSENKLAIDRLVEKITKKEEIAPLGIRSMLEPDYKELSQEINTGSFFAAKKILLVGGVENLSKEVEEFLLQPAPPGTFVILHGLSGANPFYKKVEKKGIVVELGAEKSWEKEKNGQEWILQRVAEEKKRIDIAAAELLAKESGGDIALLEHEIEKLVTYTLGRSVISKQDVLAISISRPSLSVFQLAEALFKRDMNGAIHYFHALLEEGVSYFAILKQLRGQILTDLEVASILKNGGKNGDVTATFPYMKGFILEKHLETVRTWGFEGLKRALVLVDDFELRAKEGSADYELLADLFTLKLA